MTTLLEPARALPISDSCQVLVAGGGFAGVSAALAAARCGKKVILLEREYMLGGLGTAGLVTIYLPLCDGMGHQVSFGMNEEFIRLSVKYGAEGRNPTHWFENTTAEERKKKSRYMVQYNPHLLAMEMAALLRNAGVQILYGTIAAGTILEDGVITGVIVENKSGRSAIAVDSVIDCTGDADIVAQCGVPVAFHEDKNPLAAWYYYVADGKLKLNQLGFADVRDDSADDNAEQLTVQFRVSGVDAQENSLFVEKAHEAVLQDLEERRQRHADIVPVTIPSIPQLRMTRRIQSETVATHQKTPDQIPDSVGLYSDWTTRGPVHALPLSSMYHHSVKNLLVAGRCLGADHDMWNLTRVIPVCVVSGQAAGTAFALAKNWEDLDISCLQRKLREDGVRLYPEEIIE